MEQGSNVGILFLLKIVAVSTVVVLLSDVHRHGALGGTECSAEDRACQDGKCIFAQWWCDGEEDCSHGEDEHDCPPRDCAKTEFRCDNSHCIQDILVCNGNDDCQDLSDEKDCDVAAVQVCPDGQFLCADHKRCILDDWVCDMKMDCVDQSDESTAVCGDKNCTSTEFACASGHQCIVGRWRCDGQKDCADGSDEDCDDINEEPCDVYSGQFQCRDGTCISLAQLCDGIVHCVAGEDEGQECGVACENSPCDQRCLPTPEGPVCVCHEGYQLNTDQKTCSDIDECDGLKQQVCGQTCVNFPSSYHCQCHTGYRLLSDKHTCKATDRDLVMLYSRLHEILSVDLQTRETKSSVDLQTRETKSLVTKLSKITDIAYNYLGVTGTLFWTDEEDSAVYSTDIDQLSQGPVIPLVTEGLSRPQGIAVDWLSALLYITDSGLGQIVACEMLNTNCAVLVTLPHSDSPASIVVDPSRGYMYWSSLGEAPYIAKGSMDGVDYDKFVTSDLLRPTGLFLDHTTERLFWADSQLGQISSLRFDGTGPKHVLTVEGSPFSVGVFEDRVVWSDLRSSSIMTANKFSGKGRRRLVRTMEHPLGLSLVHSTFYKHASTPCHTANHCSHICLLSRTGKELNSTCVCPVGFHFSDDGTSCEDSFTNPFLLVSRHKEILKIDLRRIGKSAEQPYKDSMKRVVAIDFDPERKAAVYSDISRGVIGAMKLFISNRPSEEVIVKELNGTVVGLAVDWVAGNLFWVDSTKRSIEVARLNGSSPITLKKNLEGNPTAIALNPKKGVLFYAIRGDKSAIVKCEMTGANCITIVTDVEECHGLAFDDVTDRLLWTDQSKGHIGAVDTDGNDHKILVPDLTSPYSVAILGDVVYWTDTESNNLHRFSLATNKPMRNLLTDGESLMGLSLVKWDRFSSVINACSNNNGGCSHLCLAQGVYSKQCACPPDWELQSNGHCKQKTVPFMCKPDELLCDNTLCLPKTLRCDGKVHCGDGGDELDCDIPFTCPPDKFKCIKGGEPGCISETWRCDHQDDCDDGSDEMGCVFECSSFEFTCKDKDCVPQATVCDGMPDCEDSSDEQDCPVTTTATPPACASADMFRCGDGHCIDRSRLCDGHVDCPNKEDEFEPCRPEPCDAHEYQCGDGRCILASYRCDGDPDCHDQSDEDIAYCAHIARTTTPTPPPVPCTEDTFVCKSGRQCISKQRLCDGANDCEDASDENGDCDLLCGDKQCSDRCIQSPSGPLCVCNLGYKLMDDHASCKDVNECEMLPPKCSQQCANTPGSFTCQCTDGYSLEEDYTGCKADGVRPKLLTGRQHEIIELTEHGHHLYNIVTEIRGLVTSLDIDQSTGDIFWINSLGFLKKQVKTTESILSIKRSLTPLLSVGFDWLTGNVYVTGVKKVIVCSGELSHCSILLRLHVNPLGIAVYPNKGLMFWTRGGQGGSAGLVRCWMTGENCEAILSSGLARPVSLTIDYPQERIYILDQLTAAVVSCDFNGKHRWSFPRLGKLSSLDVFEDWLYLTDMHNKTLVRIHKYGVGRKEVLHKGGIGHMTIRVVQPLRQPKGETVCSSLRCSHLCLLSPSGGQCACPIDYGFQGSSSTECIDCSSYCMNGASCKFNDKKILCICQPGFSGEQCSVRDLPSPTHKPLVLDASQQLTSTTEHKTTKVSSVKPIQSSADARPVTELRTTPRSLTEEPMLATSKPDDQKTVVPKPEKKEDNSPTPDASLKFNKAKHNSKSTIIVTVPDRNSSANATKASGEQHEDNQPVVAGVVVSLLLIMLLVVIVLVVIWKKGKKPTLSKLVWYHKGTTGHSKIEDQESLVPEDGIRNPTFEAQDINFNTEKSKILRYPSDSSIDSAFISTGNGLSQFDENSGSTCRLIPSEKI